MNRAKLLQQVKAWVGAYLGPEPKSLKSYATPYKREFEGRWKPSTVDALMKSISKSHVVFGGDFHGFAQSQRTHLRVLRRIPSSTPVALGLEIFESKDQALLNKFLAGKLDEKKFLDLIKWEARWGFPWGQYRPLIEIARARGWPVLALNKYHRKRSRKSLHERDDHASKILSKAMRAKPKCLFYVVFGDLHIAEEHLPKRLARHRRAPPRATFLFQDSEKLYFNLEKRGLQARVHLLQKGSKFCVLSAPPWVKWQNYLLYLEGSLDRDLHGDDYEEIDLTAHVRHFIVVLASDLGVKMAPSDIAAYEEFDPALSVVMKKSLKVKHQATARLLIGLGRSFYSPSGGTFFLASPTVNHAASLAGEYLQAKLSGRKRVTWDLPGDFRRLVWIEIFGFFLSKIINHRRKPDRLQDLRARAPALRHEVLRLVLTLRIEAISFRMKSPERVKAFRARQKASYFLASKMIGSFYGNRLFAAFEGGHIDRAHVLNWLSVDVDSESFMGSYRDLLVRLEKLATKVDLRETGI